MAVRTIRNYVQGNWITTRQLATTLNPLTGKTNFRVCDTDFEELTPYIKEMQQVPPYGLHNPFYQKSRYLLYGDISRKLANYLEEDGVYKQMANLIQVCVPKSHTQVAAEINVTKKFLENFSGDQVRFLARSFGVPGDHDGQTSHGFRFPYGPVAIVAPFNYPLEIPVLQLMGALFMGNKVLLHVDLKVAPVMEYFIKLMLKAGMPAEDLVFVNGKGPVINRLLVEIQPKVTQFTGSSRVGEKLTQDLNGKIKLEDSGFDWKVLGPDVADFSQEDFNYLLEQSDRDAYEFGGQKCSAQSILFLHSNLEDRGIEDRLEQLASKRNLKDLTNVPLLSINNVQIRDHIGKLLSIPGAKIVFGGQPILNTDVPECFGCYEPTAIYVPLKQIRDKQWFSTVTKEIFGPLQIITYYQHPDEVLEVINKMQHGLTAAVVSNDIRFVEHLVGRTFNGTTYVGARARTTGAPQNHWFGPGGDPRGGSIGTKEAIQHVWSYHREIISDWGINSAV